ncbi:GntR family transcriptional regulator [Loigolactobacillus coryniformis]|uniref:GntR family transcriptional regulator n=1 Tax=Loigolactobacillus coryniformis TaxID=1610 RepID=UPI001C5F1CCA|nr:GntR family transcriptional regulator [Loigolactobacillus coryniformis]MBW4803740.1 GntR family transcriptional regulator [Loigolactobacillus coryniformis subsp. torquens]MBW4806453.1 GntR family transcriptional regulator [Loigolactobacillus coryniformis subsp. torquens]
MHIKEIDSLYAQLAEKLKTVIQTELNPGDKMLSERQIVAQFQVSRNTVRQALSQLETLGYVQRIHGKGTFVAQTAQQLTILGEYYSFTEQMKALGRKPKTQLLTYEIVNPSFDVLKALQLPANAAAIYLKRLRLADGIPLMLEHTYLPAQKFSGLTADKVAHRPLYELFRTEFNEAFHFADESISATVLNEEDATFLVVPTGSAGMHLKRTTYDQKNNIIEYTISVARSDQFIYKVRYGKR